MPFSAQHAAAFAGHRHVLQWLEAHQPPDERRTEGARRVLFDPAVVLSAEDASDEAAMAAGSHGEAAANGSNGNAAASGEADGGWTRTADTAASEAFGCEIHTVSGEDVVDNPVGFFKRFVADAQPVCDSELA